MANEIKFPYEPSEAVKKAFIEARKRRLAARVIIDQILNCLSEDEEGFELLRKECPEMETIKGDLAFNYRNQMIEQK